MKPCRRALSILLSLALIGLSSREVLAGAAVVGAQTAGKAVQMPGLGALPLSPAGVNAAGTTLGTSASLSGALPSILPVRSPSISNGAAPAGTHAVPARKAAPITAVSAPAAGSIAAPAFRGTRRTAAVAHHGRGPGGTAALKTPSPGPSKTAARAGKLGAGIAPALKTARDSGASAADLHTAGRNIEDMLSGTASRRTSDASIVPAAPDTLRGPGHVSRGRLALRRGCDDHDHAFGHHHDHHGAESGVPAPELTPQQKKNFIRYKKGIAAVKIGIETLGLVVPIMVLTQFQAATLVSALFITADLVGMAAGWASGSWIDKIKPSRVLAVTAALQTVAIGILPLSFALGFTIPMPVFFALFVLNGALTGIFDIARRAEMPNIVGRDEGTLREYNARLYIWREIAAIAGVLGAGWFAGKFGYLPALWLHPATYAIAAFFFMRVAMSKSMAKIYHEAKKRQKTGMKDFFKEFARGAKIVFKSPSMRLGLLVNLPLTIVHKLFHALVAVVYATQVLGNPALAAVILGAWNAGELAGAWYLKRKGKSETSFGWLKVSAVAALSGWLLWAVPSIFTAAPVAFILAAAMILGEIGLAAFFQSSAPEEDVGAVSGFVYSLAAAVSMAALLGMGWVFDAFGASAGFLALAIFMTVSAGLYLGASRHFKKLARSYLYPQIGGTHKLGDPPLSE